jgi:predicted translin family RNA/ssDNA-binding protein
VCFVAAMTVYLRDQQCISTEQLTQMTGVPFDSATKFHIPIEDFLHGLVSMINELSRFAITSVIMGDYHRPLAISRFVDELHSGFQLLNLKNDSLRKRFDSIKYDVKKIEEVVYNIKLRNLAPAATE